MRLEWAPWLPLGWTAPPPSPPGTFSPRIQFTVRSNRRSHQRIVSAALSRHPQWTRGCLDTSHHAGYRPQHLQTWVNARIDTWQVNTRSSRVTIMIPLLMYMSSCEQTARTNMSHTFTPNIPFWARKYNSNITNPKSDFLNNLFLLIPYSDFILYNLSIYWHLRIFREGVFRIW